MSDPSGSIWERIVDWFRGLFGGTTGQGSATGGVGSIKDVAAKTATSAKDVAASAAATARTGAAQTLDSARRTVEDMREKGGGAQEPGGEVIGTDRLDPGTRESKGELSGAAASVTSRGYDTGSIRETADATLEDMDASGQDAHGPGTTGVGMTAEDLDQGGPDTAEHDRARTGVSEGGWSVASGVTSEANAPAEVGEGITFSPRPNEHPEADQAATDVDTSGRPFARDGGDWWDTDRPGTGTGSSLGEQGAGSETGTEGRPSPGGLGPSASAADVGTSSAGASQGGANATGSNTAAPGAAPRDTGTGTSGGGAGGPQTYEAISGDVPGTATATSETGAPARAGGSRVSSSPGATTSTTGDGLAVGGFGVSGTTVAGTSGVGVDSPATAAGAGYQGSSPVTDREGVGSYAPAEATVGRTGASSGDPDLIHEAPDAAAIRAADQADAAAAGTDAEIDEAADANAGTEFDATPDDSGDYSTAQGIVVGGLIAEDQEETGGEYSDEILVDAETQQAELPAADYEDAVTDTASTTEAVTTTLGDQATPAESGRTAGAMAAGTADDVNAPSTGTMGVNWLPGDGTTNVPDGFPLKGNASSKIYHPKESPTYDRTIAEYYFATPDDAEAAGYRLPKALQRTGEAAASAAESASESARSTISGLDGQAETTPAATTPASQTRVEAHPEAPARQASGRPERPTPQGAIRAQGATCPDDHPIKGNANSRIYHLPSESSYEQTNPEFCFASEADAQAAGFRARKH